MSFDQLASEILLYIGGYLDHEDLRALCGTSRRLMAIFQEKAYYRMEFDESPESANRLLALASGPRAQFIGNLRYKPNDPGPVNGWESDGLSDKHDPEITLSNEARQTLQSLHLFPSLERFYFDLSHWGLIDWPMAPTGFSDYAFAESFGDYDTEPWRILLEESLQALCKSAGTFSQLGINSLLPTTVEPYKVFQSDGWRSLLGSLKSFEIELAGVIDEGAGSMTIAHQEFLAFFPDSIFKHLSQVQTLRVAGVRQGVIGGYSDKEPIKWSLVQMPHLTSFELEYARIHEELVGFLANHADTLERICLRNCLAVVKRDWSAMFQVFLDRKPTQLVDFTVVAYPVYKWTERSDYYSIGDNDGFNMSEEPMEEEMRRFVVGETCESYGDIQVVEDHAETYDESELDESDVVEVWNALENLLERNRRQAIQSKARDIV